MKMNLLLSAALMIPVGCTNNKSETFNVTGSPQLALAKASILTSDSSVWTHCANENEYCSFSGTQTVRFGANGSYAMTTATGGIACSNMIFGDPAVGYQKSCDVLSSGGVLPTPSPTPLPTPEPTPLATPTPLPSPTPVSAGGNSADYAQLFVVKSGLALQVVGQSLEQEPISSSPSQLFTFPLAATGKIKIAAGSMCVTVSAADPSVIMGNCANTSVQEFNFIPQADGSSLIQSVATLQCLNILYGSTAPGLQVIQYNCNGATEQRFINSALSQPSPAPTPNPTPVSTPVPTATPTPAPSSSTINPKSFKLMAMGDSITYGFLGEDIGGYRGPLYNSLVAAGYGVTMVGSFNCGQPTASPMCEGHTGATVAQLEQFVSQGNVVANAQPDIIMLMIGVNTLFQNPTNGTSVALAGVNQLLNDIYAQAPNVTVILAGDLQTTQMNSSEQVPAYNQGLQAIVATRQAQGMKIRFADMYSVVPIAELTDGLHPTDAGYTLLAQAWYNQLLLVLPSLSAGMMSPTPTPTPLMGTASSYVPLGYALTFDDEFASLSTISAGPVPYTPGVKWYNGIEQCCMGTSDGKPGSMYPTLVNGVTIVDPYSLDPSGGLDISLTLNGNWWNSGVMQTVDSSHLGFSQQYGYFEMSAQFPAGNGTWPAFWMLPVNQNTSHGEIDIFEAYTQFHNGFCTTLHDWDTDANSKQKCFNNLPIDLTAGYHVYGMLWTSATMTFYVDGQQVYQAPTLAVMNAPYYMLVDLGIGGGWPTENTPSPSVMRVKYVRAYAPK